MENEKLFHVLRIEAITNFDNKIPKTFIKNIQSKSAMQTKSFTLYVKLLPFNKYQQLKSNKYSITTIIDIFNNHIISPDESLHYIMRWPILVKNIIDYVFSLSDQGISDLEVNPNLLFQRLKDKRAKMFEHNALLDSLVMQSFGIEIYMQFRNLDSFEKKLDFVATTEHFTQVVLEERYKMALKIKKPINLKADKYFAKEYNAKMNVDDETSSLMNKASQALDEQLKEDKQLASLGVKRKVNTSQENASLMKHN